MSYVQHFHDIITGRVKKKGVDLLLAFAAFVLTECGSRWEEWTAAPYGALKVLEACSDEAVIFKVLRWACAAFAAGGTLYQLLSWQLRAFVEGLVTSEVTTMPRLLDGVVSPSIASDASSGRGYVHADFWIHLALETNGSGSSGNPSAAAATAHKRICEDAFCQDIIAGVLRAWFVRRSTEIPFPQFQAVAMSLAAEAGLPDDGTASLIPFDPLSPADPIPKSLSSSSSFSLFASMWSWLSHATTEHLLAVPFLVFEVLYIETRSILEAEKVLPQLLSGRMIQWLNYTLRLGQDCEIITLFTQASLYLYLRCLFDPENTKSKKSFAILL